MHPVLISLIAFVVIIGGALFGAFLRYSLPGHHLSDDSKDIVRLGAGLIATIAALVLGLLISSAKSSYDNQSSQVRQFTATVIMLDRLLDQYGGEAREARGLLRKAVDVVSEQIWTENRNVDAPSVFVAPIASERVSASILALHPQTEAQTALKSRIIQAGSDLGQQRLSLFVQRGGSIPLPFLCVLVFWLAILFASFSLFSQLNPIAVAALVVFALSAAGALFLILEMDQPFGGLMQIPSGPLRHALAPLT